jgi:hypothetical protein
MSPTRVVGDSVVPWLPGTPWQELHAPYIQSTHKFFNPDKSPTDLMLISGNNTRWNSAHKSITRAIRLQAKISALFEIHRKEIGRFSMLQEDWDVLKRLAQGPEIFWTQTEYPQGKAKFGHHGAIWEALPAM